MSRRTAQATVTVRTRPLWRIRLTHEIPRYLLCGLALAGLAASARFAIAPPRPVAATSTAAEANTVDPAAEAYAALFARRYLTWNAAEPQLSMHALEPFVGSGMEATAGLNLPPTGEQRVEWVEVVQARLPAPGEHVYTVAAQTSTMGLIYLTVPVARTVNGSLALDGYPAFVGAPAAEPSHIAAHLREVTDSALVTVVGRALRNYLAASSSELAADLAGGARVSLPTQPLTLQALQHLDWAQEGDAVLATVQAQDARGVRYTLAYELDVLRVQGRWEVAAVQTDPDA